MPEKLIQLPVKPQVNISRSSIIRMWIISIYALLAVIQSAITDNGASFALAFVALVSAVLSELLITSSRYGLAKIRDGSAIVTALVLVLMLPNQIHPLYAAMGAVFAIVVVKHSFGGLGSNWMNPALGGWLFIRFSWPFSFTEAFEQGFSIESADNIIGSFLNRTVFSVFGAELPSGYINLFSSNAPGIIADRAVLVLILGSIIIAALCINRFWLSFLYLAIFSLFVKMFGDIGPEGIFWNGDVLLNLFSGGTLLCAFILITEPSSGAKSNQGCIAVVFLAAFFSFIFRYYGGTIYGSFFAIALINGITPIVRRIERGFLYSKTIAAVESRRDEA